MVVVWFCFKTLGKKRRVVERVFFFFSCLFCFLFDAMPPLKVEKVGKVVLERYRLKILEFFFGGYLLF